MPSTYKYQARQWLRAVAREGARYVSELSVVDDEPYASLEAAACHYDHEGRDDLYMEEYIWVDVGRMAATLAVRWVADGDYDAGAYQGPGDQDDPGAGYGDVHLDRVSGVAQRYRRSVAAGIRAALALASELDDLPYDPAAVTPVV